jgi:hypothetical protein
VVRMQYSLCVDDVGVRHVRTNRLKFAGVKLPAASYEIQIGTPAMRLGPWSYVLVFGATRPLKVFTAMKYSAEWE